MGISTTYKSNLRHKLWYFIVILLWEILRWLLKGISEEAIFSKIYQWIAEREGVLKSVLDFFQSNPWYLWLILPIGILVLLIWAYLDTKREEFQKTDTEGKSLIDILTEMHERMMHLKDTRLRKRFDKKRFEDACPLFFDQLGIVKVGEWDTYRRKLAKRVKYLVPKSPEKKARLFWRYKVIGEAKDIVEELVNSKDWQIDDLVKAGGHLDSIHMGLGELRDNDEQWQSLLKKIKPYTTDFILRGLIDNYISHSYAFCSALLATSYGNRLPKHEFGRMLCSALVNSNISPDKIAIALGEFLQQIGHRLKEINLNNSEIKATTSYIKVVDIYEDNKGECGLICRNISSSNVDNCHARLIDLAFEITHPRYSLERYSKAEDLIFPQHVGGAGDGKIPLFRWGFSGSSKGLEIVYKSGTQKIGYGILNVPILVLLNIWADNVQSTYAVCKLEDRLGWGYSLSILKTGILLGNVELATYQKPNPDIEGTSSQ